MSLHRYPTACLFNCQDLTARLERYKKLKGRNKGIRAGRTEARIIQTFFQMVLDDVVTNNVQFKFSTSSPASIQMETVSGDDFIRAKQNGAFLDIDPEKSDFVGHQIALNYVRGSKKKSVKFAVGSPYKDIIVERTNNGYKY